MLVAAFGAPRARWPLHVCAAVLPQKDIEERHRKMKKQRQVAERRRVEGNEAFRKGQFSLAYQRYAEGLECHKANPALHCNAAMASIKLGCYVQAIEHCDRVLGIQEFLLDNMRDPLVPKALHRRVPVEAPHALAIRPSHPRGSLVLS